MSVDRTPKPCRHPQANHQHGTYATYCLDACRCLPCAFACHKYGLELRGRHKSGDMPMVDAETVIAYAQELMASGWTLRSIASTSGVSLTSVTRIACKTSTRKPSRVKADTAAAILALPVGIDHGYMLTADGIVRRVRALATLGWAFRDISVRAGLASRAVADINAGIIKNVRPETHAAICRVYDELWEKEATGACAVRMRSYARRNEWAPPMAWDDDTIDDPSAVPDLGQKFDDIHVERLSLYREGMSDGQIAGLLGTHRDAIRIWRVRQGLPANFKHGRGEGVMTVVKQVTQVRCDGCQRAWIYPEGDVDTYLLANDWTVAGERHACPCCSRREA